MVSFFRRERPRLQGLAGDLGRVAPRPHLEEELLPGFVAGLQLLGVAFHRRQELALLAELFVQLRPFLQEFEDYRFVLHIGLHWVDGLRSLEAQARRLGQGGIKRVVASPAVSLPWSGIIRQVRFPALSIAPRPAPGWP